MTIDATPAPHPDAGAAAPELDALWAAVVSDARAQIGDASWDSWLSVLRLVGVGPQRIAVDAPHHARTWIEARLFPLLGASASRVLHRPVRVVYAPGTEKARPGRPGRPSGRGAPARRTADLLPDHLLERADPSPPATLLPARSTIAAVPAALLCSRGREDAALTGRHARYAQHPSLRPGELTPRDVLCAATLYAAATHHTAASPPDRELCTTASALWRALDPDRRGDRRPGWDALRSLRSGLTRISAFWAVHAPGTRLEIAVEPGAWLPAHEAPAGFGSGGRRPTIRIALPPVALAALRSWQRKGWRGRPPDGYALLRLDHLRRIRCASELSTYVIFDSLPAQDARGRRLALRDLPAAREAGGSRRTLRLSGAGIGELGDRLGIRHARRNRRAQRLMLNLLRLAGEVAPERFGRPAVRITGAGVVELVVPLRDSSEPRTADDRNALQDIVDRQLRLAIADAGALIAFPEHLATSSGRGPPGR